MKAIISNFHNFTCTLIALLVADPPTPKCLSLLLLKVLFRELSRRENLDALMSVDHKQMPIAAAHDLCASGGEQKGQSRLT